MPVRRVYSSKKYSRNPFFQKRRSRIKGMSWKKKLIIAGIIMLVFIIFYLLFFNKYFLINNVIVQDSGRIDQYRVYNIINKQLQRRRFFFLNQQNIFIFSKRQVNKEILKNYLVNNLKVNKDLPRTIKI